MEAVSLHSDLYPRLLDFFSQKWPKLVILTLTCTFQSFPRVFSTVLMFMSHIAWTITFGQIQIFKKSCNTALSHVGLL